MIDKEKSDLKQKVTKKKAGVFPKIFAYTMFLVLLICAAAVFIFSREFLSFYRAEQRRIFTSSLQPMISHIEEKPRSPQEITEIASAFANNNQSFIFRISTEDGIIFSTPFPEELSENNSFVTVNLASSDSYPVLTRFFSFTADVFNRTETDGYELQGGIIPRENASDENPGNLQRLRLLRNGSDEITETGIYTYNITGYASGNIDYTNLIKRILLALAIMLAIAVLGAVLFAKKITKPLEDEITRRSVIEENQRLFFSAASHELKTPIASARALVEGMIAGVGDYKDHPKYLRECLDTLDTQGNLVSEILDIVKLSDNETELTFENINLRDLGYSSLYEYRSLAENKNITIKGEFPDYIISADRVLLYKVFSNIIANAVQNTPAGGEIRITSEKNKNIYLGILNTGVKIPNDVLSRLFEPFYRQDNARTRGIQTGLGLTIVKKALDRMNIKFALENTDEGVLFWMELPLA
jgi:two-component system sensor histidine kinase VanS